VIPGSTFMGRELKRAAPTLSDFLSLGPGETLTKAVDLSRVYAMPDGLTSVHFDNVLNVLTQKSAFTAGEDLLSLLEPVPVASNPVKLLVRSAPQPFIPRSVGLPVTPGNGTLNAFIGCSASQGNIVAAAIPRARTISQNVLNYMNSQCDSAYLTWMGQYANSNRWQTVQGNFGRITPRMVAQMNADCSGSGCGSGVFAFVYPTDSTLTVHLCSAFWSASPTPAFDSQPGTLVHEMSHFRVVAGTQDFAYGTSAAQNLARTNPARAIQNADNHEYFSESQPRC